MRDTAKKTQVSTRTAKERSGRVPATPERTDDRSVPFIDHLRQGAGELFVQHLHGVAMGLTTFMEARENSANDTSSDRFQTIRNLNAAYRRYRELTHSARSEFLDHLLQPRSRAKRERQGAR